MNAIYPTDLSDAEWECLARHLPVRRPRGRPCGHSLRAILDAIFYLLRTGCPWRYLPRDFPPWQTVYYHFRRFRLDGTWHHLLATLRTAERRRVGKEPQPSAAIIDAQSVKTVEESASISGYDGHKRVKGRKRGCPRLLEVTVHGGWRGRGCPCSNDCVPESVPLLPGRGKSGPYRVAVTTHHEARRPPPAEPHPCPIVAREEEEHDAPRDRLPAVCRH